MDLISNRMFNTYLMEILIEKEEFNKLDFFYKLGG